MPKARERRMPGLGALTKPLALLLLLAGIFSLVWIRTRVMEVRYEIGALEETRRQLLSEQKKLVAMKTEYSAPSRIAMRAARLGLTLPDRSRVYLVRYEPAAIRVNKGIRGSGGSPSL